MEYYVGSWMPSVQVKSPRMQSPNVWSPMAQPWFLTSAESDSGVTVTADTALTHTPLWHGLTLLGGDAGSLPLQLKRRDGDNVLDVTGHVGYQLAAVRPNGLMCPCSWWESVVITAILHGNAIAEIRRSSDGMPLPAERGGGFALLPPGSTSPWFDSMGKLWIESWIVGPNHNRERRLYDPDDVFHLPSLSMDGFWGRGVIDVGKNRIGQGLAMEKQGNRFMRNGMQPSWLFKYPGQLYPEEGIAIAERLRQMNQGVENAGRNLVLDSGVEAQQLGMSFEHAQFVELAKLDVQMVSSLLGIPAVMLNAMDKMTFSNAEESERWYINRTLRRWLNKIQQELAAKLLTDRERLNMFFKHDLGPLLMGRLSERMAAYGSAISSRIMSPNEVRSKEGMNPYEGGDVFENPNTSTPNQESEEETEDEGVSREEDRNRMASLLRPLIKREDYEVAEACRRERNVVDWLTGYYQNQFLRELIEVAPRSAGEYCDGRFKLWLKVSNHVNTTAKLGEIVKAQGQTVGDRVAGILTAELIG